MGHVPGYNEGGPSWDAKTGPPGENWGADPRTGSARGGPSWDVRTGPIDPDKFGVDPRTGSNTCGPEWSIKTGPPGPDFGIDPRARKSKYISSNRESEIRRAQIGCNNASSIANRKARCKEKILERGTHYCTTCHYYHSWVTYWCNNCKEEYKFTTYFCQVCGREHEYIEFWCDQCQRWEKIT